MEWAARGDRWLIPAHAGKTQVRSVDEGTRSGSSPLTRGKPSSCGRWRGRCLAHPRSRGENSGCASRQERRWGSSPLTRGKPQGRRPPRHRRRLIPAHAGKTYSQRTDCEAKPAHPRSRGENDRRRPRAPGLCGSSPLTRGKPRCAPPRPHQARLIPAHAGKT